MKKLISGLLTGLVLSSAAITIKPHLANALGNHPPQAVAASNLISQSSVDLNSVGYIKHSAGHFQSNGDGTWQEYNNSGTPTFRFRETGRADGLIFMDDRSRNVFLRMDLNQMKVILDNNKATLFTIAEVTGAKKSAVASVAVIPGKQCIFNNGAFSVKVDWYNPGAVVFKGKDPTEFSDYSKYEVSGKPVQTNNNVTVGLKSCTEGANRTAVVTIVGQKIANNAITIAAGTLTGIATGIAGAFVCVGTVGAGCPAAVAGVTAATSGVVSGITAALPDVQQIAYLGSPGTTNYVDLSGTIWQVGVANNVSLNDSRGFDKIATFFTGGTPGPRSISFNNQAGYVAEMVVMYFQKQYIGGNFIDMPVVKTSGNISVGRTQHINVPLAISNQPIQVFIKGVGTIKKDIYGVTIPAKFSGNKCYKAYGTIFNAKGSTCR